MEEIKKTADMVWAPAKFNWKWRLSVQLPVLQMHIDWLLSGTTEVNLAVWWLMIDIQLMIVSFKTNFHILERNLITGGSLNVTLCSSSFWNFYFCSHIICISK